MKRTPKIRMVTAAMLALLGFSASAHAQSADALIDKLVEKGILNVREANELREETDKNFTSAYSVKSGMPEWVSALKISGDLRGRYESFYGENDNFTDRQRFRYRLRVGITASLFDDLEVGLRLTSSEPGGGGSFGGDPISGNSTFQDNASKKFVYIDLAYGKWTPIHGPKFGGGIVVGKMENPFVFSDMVFDADYTPEGAALQGNYNINDKHVVRATGGIFLVDEISASSDDPFWFGGQIRLDSTWTSRFQTTAGFAGLSLQNEDALTATRSSTFNVTPSATNLTTSTTWTIPNQNAGNLRSPVSGQSGTVGVLQERYNPIVADLALTYSLDKFWMYNTKFPIRLAGEYMYNPSADSDNKGYQFGITFGKAGKKGLWEISYRYKYLEGDAWFEEFVDSDFGAFYQAGSLRSANSSGYFAGTNVKGHVIRAIYSPFDSLNLSVTAFLTQLIEESPEDSESGMTRLQVDATLRF